MSITTRARGRLAVNSLCFSFHLFQRMISSPFCIFHYQVDETDYTLPVIITHKENFLLFQESSFLQTISIWSDRKEYKTLVAPYVVPDTSCSSRTSDRTHRDIL